MKRKLLKLLFRSFDDSLNDKQQRLLDEALGSSQQLQLEKKEIESLRNTLSNSAVKSFQPLFAERVIARLNQPMVENGILDLQKFYDSLLWSFRRIALAGSLLAIALFVYNLGIPDNFSLLNSMTFSDITLQQILSISIF